MEPGAVMKGYLGIELVRLGCHYWADDHFDDIIF